MKKGMLFLLASLVSYGQESFSPVQVVEGDGWHYVKVSLTDVNRIVCPVEIKSVVYSKEKELQVETSGRNAFVKFLVRENPDGSKEISDIPRELYVECGDKVFQLILLPERVPAVQVVLKLPYAEKERAREYEKANPYDELMLSLIRHVYLEEPPEGYEVKLVNKPYREFVELSMILYRVYEGDLYRVEEYILSAKEDVELWEGQFLPYLNKPLAISIVDPILKAGQSTRLIAVERRD